MGVHEGQGTVFECLALAQTVKKLAACAANSFGIFIFQAAVWSPLLVFFPPRPDLPPCSCAAVPCTTRPSRRSPVRFVRADQSGSHSDHGQIGLRLRTTMLHRTQLPIRRALRACTTITSCPNWLSTGLTQCVWHLSLHAIRLRGTAPNASCMAFAGVLRRCSNSMLPVFVHHVVPAGTTSQIYSDRQLLLGNTPALLCRCNGTFFTAGLPLSASSMSETWESPSIPFEDGFLIQSVYSDGGIETSFMPVFHATMPCRITAPEQRRRATQSLFFCMARSSHPLRGCVLDGTLQLRVAIGPSRSSNSEARRTSSRGVLGYGMAHTYK